MLKTVKKKVSVHSKTEVADSSVYFHMPPMYCFCSNPVTAKPSSARFFTAARPEAPKLSLKLAQRYLMVEKVIFNDLDRQQQLWELPLPNDSYPIPNLAPTVSERIPKER